MRFPTFYIPHGGGPCFFMDWNPPHTWDRMAAWLRGLARNLPARPEAILVVSAHWEEPEFTVLTAPRPPLLFDYYGFPPHTYQLSYPAPGAPELAGEVRNRLAGHGIASCADATRGFDHGVFIPLLLVYPQADIPVLQLSLRAGLDPELHLRAGAALAPLREQGVLIIGSGMSFHNMRALMGGGDTGPASTSFDDWLQQTCQLRGAARAERLGAWEQAPAARVAHPREEHLLPLMVAAGAAGDEAGTLAHADQVMGAAVSGYRFGDF